MIMEEEKLYNLVVREDDFGVSFVSEAHWGSGSYSDEFLVWVSYYFVEDFFDELKGIFGYGLFDDGGFEGNFQADGICINLVDALQGYGIDFEELFPRDDFSH